MLLRLAESRSSPPPHAADCNSSELVALTAGGELSVMRRCSCGSKSRSGRTPPTGRPATRRSRSESCRSSRASVRTKFGYMGQLQPLAPRERYPRLFREATQLKSVGAAVRVAGIEVLRVETQVHPIAAADRRRIAEPAVADATRPARSTDAEARGAPTGRSTGSLYPESASPIPCGNATENRGYGGSCSRDSSTSR